MPSILCVRNRMGRSVIEAVLSDFDRNGPEAVRTLRRQADPAGYAKTLCNLLAVRERLRAETGDRTTDKGRSARTRRTRMAHTLLAALEQDFDAHGSETIARLRTEKPQAWARLLSEVVQFKVLPKTPKPAPRRQARPVRMKNLIQALSEQPVDPASAVLPMTQAQALPDALAVLRGTWPQPVEVWRQAFGQAWDDALVDWLAIHLPASIVLPKDHDPGGSSRPKPEAGSGAPAADWLDAFGNAGQPDEVQGERFTMRRT